MSIDDDDLRAVGKMTSEDLPPRIFGPVVVLSTITGADLEMLQHWARNRA